jgi:hypothetical protein
VAVGTLITSLTDNSAVQAVTSTTLVAPTEPGNKTNRGMALPNVGEILVVQDGKDADGLTTWDKADKIINIVGWSLTYQQVLDALNLNTGLTAGDTSYSTGSDDGWQVAGSRVNTTGCLQTALRGQYGDGNYYGFNGVSSSSIGTIYWHWGAETWVGGSYFTSGGMDGMTCNTASDYEVASFWKGVFLR